MFSFSHMRPLRLIRVLRPWKVRKNFLKTTTKIQLKFLSTMEDSLLQPPSPIKWTSWAQSEDFEAANANGRSSRTASAALGIAEKSSIIGESQLQRLGRVGDEEEVSSFDTEVEPVSQSLHFFILYS